MQVRRKYQGTTPHRLCLLLLFFWVRGFCLGSRCILHTAVTVTVAFASETVCATAAAYNEKREHPFEQCTDTNGRTD